MEESDLGFDVTETVDAVSVSVNRKVQVDRYEPVEAGVEFTATKPDGVSDEELETQVRVLGERATSEAERLVTRRVEEAVREGALGDDE